ncbi:MAG: TrmH family RNA methyltransferase [Ilumatobacteraceae bacterium]
MRVDDPNDERLDAFRWRERQLTNIAQRKSTVQSGLFIAEGDLVVERALAANCTPRVVLCDERFAARFDQPVSSRGGTVIEAPADVRREVTGLGVPLGAIGVFERPALREPDELCASARRMVLLDCVDNPSNVGSIARSAAALGWDALVLDSTSSDPLARRALRVSMGTTFRIGFARTDDLAALIERLNAAGVTTIALTPHRESGPVQPLSDLGDIGERVAIVLGSERQGVRTEIVDRCSHAVRIEMAEEVDSLNVATAAAIACWALR